MSWVGGLSALDFGSGLRKVIEIIQAIKYNSFKQSSRNKKHSNKNHSNKNKDRDKSPEAYDTPLTFIFKLGHFLRVQMIIKIFTHKKKHPSAVITE